MFFIASLSLSGFREQICSYLKCDEEHRHRLKLANVDLNRTNPPNV